MAVVTLWWSTRCFGAGGVGKRPWRWVEPRAKWLVCLGARAAEADPAWLPVVGPGGSNPPDHPGQSDNCPTTMARRSHEHRLSPITPPRTPDTNSNEATRRSMGVAAAYSRPHLVMAAAKVILSPGISTMLRAGADKLAEQAWASSVLNELDIVR